MTVLAIDPGPSESAFVRWDGERIIDKGKIGNETLARMLTAGGDDCRVYIEMIGHYGTGMPAGKEVFHTCLWIGEFIRCWRPREYELILRPTVKAHICGSARAKDQNVRQALIDRLGEPGTKKTPGLTYGVAGDIWAALAVAVCGHDSIGRLSSRNDHENENRNYATTGKTDDIRPVRIAALPGARPDVRGTNSRAAD